MKNRVVWQLSTAISLALSQVAISTVQNYTLAQPLPDNSLGGENSIVIQEALQNFLIEGGAIRGENLFHSFTEFNVDDGGNVFFANPEGILNILTRVTGDNPSNILGTLGVNGGANLFLLNPNGILFGENAQLSLTGSFLATTADSFVFADGFEFSASNPQGPPLLTVNIPIGLRFRDNPGDINVDRSVLEVNQGQSLSLIGGNVNLQGNGNLDNRRGLLNAPGGSVELGGLSTAGTITINEDLSLNFAENLLLGDVNLTDASSVNVRSGGGGFITVNAANLELSNQSELFAGIDEGMGSPSAQAGDIIINATESVRVIGTSPMGAPPRLTETAIRNHMGLPPQIDTEVSSAAGNTGEILITTPLLEITDGGRISSLTFGQGNTNNINIDASQVVLDGQATAILNQVTGDNVSGNVGDIRIMADSVSLNNNAFIANQVMGDSASGDSGDIRITADSVSLDNSAVIANPVAGIDATGNSGDIRITADSVSLGNGTFLFSATNGRGDTGNIMVEAQQVSLENAEIVNVAQRGSEGNAGNIEINADVFNLDTSRLRVEVQADASGDVGNIIVNASERVSLSNGISGIGLFSNTGGAGNSGDIIVSSPQVSLNNNGEIASVVQDTGTGNSGNIEINVDVFDLDTSRLRLESRGNGNTGNLIVNASERVSLSNGVDTISFFSNTTGAGDSGDIIVSSPQISLANGARINNQVRGANATGNSGDTRITADFLSLGDGTLLFTATEGRGDTGNIMVEAQQVSLENAEILNNVQSGGRGNSGNIEINTNTLQLNNTSKLQVQSLGDGDAGNIIVNASERVSLNNGVGVSGVNFFSNATSNGNSGNIIVSSPQIFLDNNAEISSTVSATGIGNTGNIEINTDRLELNNTSKLQAQTQGFGNSGNIVINATESISLSNESLILSTLINSPQPTTETTQTERKAGDISIDTGSLFLTDSQLLANTRGRGDAGDITIEASGQVVLAAETIGDENRGAIQSELLDNAVGDAGNITINASTLELQDFAFVSVEALQETTGKTGSIEINADTIRIQDGSVLSAITANDSDGGDIIITGKTFQLQGLGRLLTLTVASGSAGNIEINGFEQINLSGSDVPDNVPEVPSRSENIRDAVSDLGSGLFATTSSDSTGNGGRITLNSGSVTLTDGASVSVDSLGNGTGGDINITANSLRLNNGEISARATNNDGGSITLQISERLQLSNNSEISTDSPVNGGNIFIDPEIVIIEEESKISANSQGTGEGGNILLIADNLTLDDGEITAETANSDGGNITLTIADLLLLRNGSLISAEASGDGDGGNVIISTQFLLALPQQDSNIIAKASQGDGGGITINTEGIWGIQERSAKPGNGTNDIDASSEFGFSGTVSINTPDVDPSQVFELPEEVVDEAKLVAQNACQLSGGSQFASTGRGGLPTNPNDAISSDTVRVDLVEPVPSSTGNVNLNANLPLDEQGKPIVPARGWIFTEDGKVLLTAYNPEEIQRSRLTSNNCNPR